MVVVSILQVSCAHLFISLQCLEIRNFLMQKIGASSALHIVVLFYRWFIFHIIYLLIEGDNVFCISEKEFLCTKKYCRVFFEPVNYFV